MGLILTSSQTIKRELDNGLLIHVLSILSQPINVIYAYYPNNKITIMLKQNYLSNKNNQ
jgi:hypothetical protein